MRHVFAGAMAAALMWGSAAPAASATACPQIEGNAMFDFGANVGHANVSYEGERLRVPFFSVGFEETGPNTADIFFVWEFPQGDVLLVEHSTNVPKGGPAVEFDSTIDVLDGGSGSWAWNGTANLSSARAAIGQISGEICIDG